MTHHSCNSPSCPECLNGYVPQPPPEKGSSRWKNEVAQSYATQAGWFIAENSIHRLPVVQGVALGYFAIRYVAGVGWDGFRVDEIKEQTP